MKGDPQDRDRSHAQPRTGRMRPSTASMARSSPFPRRPTPGLEPAPFRGGDAGRGSLWPSWVVTIDPTAAEATLKGSRAQRTRSQVDQFEITRRTHIAALDPPAAKVDPAGTDARVGHEGGVAVKRRRSRGAAPKASEMATMRRALADASRRHSGALLRRIHPASFMAPLTAGSPTTIDIGLERRHRRASLFAQRARPLPLTARSGTIEAR